MNASDCTPGLRVVYELTYRRLSVACEVVAAGWKGSPSTIHVREVNGGKAHYVTADKLSPVGAAKMRGGKGT